VIYDIDPFESTTAYHCSHHTLLLPSPSTISLLVVVEKNPVMKGCTPGEGVVGGEHVFFFTYLFSSIKKRSKNLKQRLR